jgi:hypothetical protein
MKFLDNLVARFRKKTDAKNDEVKRNTKDAMRSLDVLSVLGLGGGYHRSREEREFDRRAVAGAKLSKRFPLGSRLLRCRQGFYIKRWGYTPYSGPAPSMKSAEKAALRNLGL